MLGCLSMGLLGLLCNEQTLQLCQLMKALESAPDYVLLVHQLLRGAFSLLLRATNIKTVRLVLVRDCVLLSRGLLSLCAFVTWPRS